MIFVDTGAWFATFVPWDADHQQATDWFRRNHEPLVTTDYVIDETLTLLRSRGERARGLVLAEDLFHGDLAEVHFMTEGEIRAAVAVYRQFADKDWSLTDCTSKVVIEGLGLTTAFAFDQHFRQFGTVKVVP